jgi:hypothetical protein
MSGWNELGDLLGGGLEGRKEKAFQDGRFRSAQTEDALTNARVNQAKALQTEAENQARADFAAAQARGEVDYTAPSSSMITQALLGGLGADLPHAGQFNLDAQQYRNRNTLGDQNASALSRSRASDAVQGKYEGDLQAVGSRGVYNRTDEVPDLSVMAGIGEGPLPSAPIQNFNFRHGLKTPEEQAQFDQMVRQDRIFNSGGVNYVMPGVNGPNAAPPKPLVTRQETADNASTIAADKATAVTQSKLASALPGVEESLDTFSKGIDEFLAEPGFDMVYGKSGAASKMLGDFAPEDYRNARAKLRNLNAEAFQNSVQKMRGLGSLSNAEGEKVQAALTEALDESQDEEHAARAFAKLSQRLERFRRVAELEAGMKNVPGITVGPGATPPATGAGPTSPAFAPKSFNTEAEAAAAGLSPGTKVIIGGVSGTWE